MPVKDEVLRTVRDLAAGPEMDREIGQRVMCLPSDSLSPAYSSDIAAAWNVVEKLVREDDLYFGAPHYKNRRQSLGPLGYPAGTECWYCVINSKIFNKVVICADSAALAICRAALVWARTAEVAPPEKPPP
jgi:ABA sandwich protein